MENRQAKENSKRELTIKPFFDDGYTAKIKCPLGCGKIHIHGSGTGWRVAHCLNSNIESYYLLCEEQQNDN